MEIVEYSGEEVIFHKVEKDPLMVICLGGFLRKQSTKEILCGKGKIVGEDYLTIRGKDIKLTDGIITEKGTILAKLSRAFFHLNFDCFLEELVKRTEIEDNKVQKQLEEEKQQFEYDKDKLVFEDLLVLKEIGCGQFGSVLLVKHENEFYALKCIPKQMLIDKNIENHVIEERKVLEVVKFPLIMKHFKCFTDLYNVYFLTEFIRGMELFDVIRKIGLLEKSQTQFYIGTFILCLEHLHSQLIVYRDLKPENVMVNSVGQAKLIDLGTAKFLKGNKGFVQSKTYTLIGTPHYMAPEVLSGKGYNFLADLWSVGICMYEFMCGMVPFGDDDEDPYVIYKIIIKAETLEFPNYFNENSSKPLMNQLLSKIPEVRLGPSYSALKSNSWFKDFDWV